MPHEPLAFKQPALTAMNDWPPGDFLCHFAGIRQTELGKLIAQYAAASKTP
ncbi:MAG: hypothetical protein H7Y06_12395 [Opitutaceae bacterium]|nr:hypothetical protein [Opitutaceae bacterium]